VKHGRHLGSLSEPKQKRRQGSAEIHLHAVALIGKRSEASITKRSRECLTPKAASCSSMASVAIGRYTPNQKGGTLIVEDVLTLEHQESHRGVAWDSYPSH